jgi:hypothetical protein
VGRTQRRTSGRASSKQSRQMRTRPALPRREKTRADRRTTMVRLKVTKKIATARKTQMELQPGDRRVVRLANEEHSAHGQMPKSSPRQESMPNRFAPNKTRTTDRTSLYFPPEVASKISPTRKASLDRSVHPCRNRSSRRCRLSERFISRSSVPMRSRHREQSFRSSRRKTVSWRPFSAIQLRCSAARPVPEKRRRSANSCGRLDSAILPAVSRLSLQGRLLRIASS